MMTEKSTSTDKGSGVTTRAILKELRETRVAQLRAAYTRAGLKPAKIATLIDGFEGGFQQALVDLIAMGIVVIADDHAAEAAMAGATQP